MGVSDYLYARPSFISGVSRLFDFGNTLNIYNVSRTPQMTDSHAIWSDWYATGNDIRHAVRHYSVDPQFHESKSR